DFYCQTYDSSLIAYIF
nr:immunoglobulin light chain junction region [Macaca mulatta]